MVELEREDVQAALLLSWLKYTPVTQEDVEKMKEIDVLVNNSKRKKLARINNADAQLSKKAKNLSRKSSGSAGKDSEVVKKTEILEAPEAQLSKKAKNLSRKSCEVVGELDRKVVRIKKTENQETPEAALSKKAMNLSSGLMNLPRESSEVAKKIKKTENLEAPDAQLSKKAKNLSSGLMNLARNSSGSAGKDSESDEKSKKNPVRIKKTENQGTPEAALSKKAMNSYGNSNQILKRARVSPLNSPEKFESLPALPPIECLRTLIGECSKPFMKNLTKSDVDEHQGRLLLNNEDVKKNLSPILKKKFEYLVDGIEVKTYDPMGKYYKMRFKTWGNYKSYVLLGSWRHFIQQHELEENDCVTIWMFKHSVNGEFCFALTWKKDEDDDEEEEEEAAAARVVGTDPDAFRSEDEEAQVVGSDGWHGSRGIQE
ncbi:hypothetical protein P3S68_008650 [Capsicum galapagoense]